MMYNEHVASYYFFMQDATADYDQSDAWWGMWVDEVGGDRGIGEWVKGLQI